MPISHLKILIKGAGDIASGIALRLYKSNFRKICMTEVSQPLAIRREVSFSDAVYDGEKIIEGIIGELISAVDQIKSVWDTGRIPVVVDPEAKIIDVLKPDVVVDAILAKKNLGTRITDAPLVIGLGPGFYAGKDVHHVVETHRGHHLGRVINQGEAQKNTGIPGVIAGYGAERVLHAPKDGRLSVIKQIGEVVEKGDIVAVVDGIPIKAQFNGIVRGMLKDGIEVREGLKTGDIDARIVKESCYTVSDKSLAVGGGVIECILSRFNQ